ncbi:hypothetical protein ACP90_18975 [Labrenzia sp. CP4]|mgnify:CR=1 FL=1|nr:hypothetical protein ACP90_18975 [Labrenzia sp. CP4]
MKQFALQTWKALFSQNGGKKSPTSQTGTPYFNDFEKKLIKQKLNEVQEEAKIVAQKRGYKVHPRIAERKKVSA